MTPEEAEAATIAFREALITLGHDALATLTLGLALLVLLSAIRTVRHW